MKNEINKMTQFLVIGLGRFGKSVAETLAEADNEVTVIDTNAAVLKEIKDKVTQTAVADCTSTDVLVSLGAKDMDCAVVCVGNDIQSSILITMACKEIGMKFVAVKAINEVHKKLLEKIGADMVVFPEDYMGRQVALMLSQPKTNLIAELSDDFKIIEILTPQDWREKSVAELNIRSKYKVNIVSIKKENHEVMLPSADTILKEGDSLIIAGTLVALARIEKLVTEAILNNSKVFEN